MQRITTQVGTKGWDCWEQPREWIEERVNGSCWNATLCLHPPMWRCDSIIPKFGIVFFKMLYHFPLKKKSINFILIMYKAVTLDQLVWTTSLVFSEKMCFFLRILNACGLRSSCNAPHQPPPTPDQRVSSSSTVNGLPICRWKPQQWRSQTNFFLV